MEAEVQYILNMTAVEYRTLMAILKHVDAFEKLNEEQKKNLAENARKFYNDLYVEND